MASKSKNKGRNQSDLAQQAEKHLARHDYKQALKDARVCYRQEATETHRKLLERAAFARARELMQAGLKPQAVDVVNELLPLGITEASVKAELPELLLRLGLQNKLAGLPGIQISAETQARLTATAADFAVLRPDEAASIPAEIRVEGRAVRNALERLDAGDETAALEFVKDIPRNSPLADWKLFVRGLAAFQRNDAEAMRANWDRLAPARRPFKVAAVLRGLREHAAPDGADPQIIAEMAAVERELFGGSIADLRQLRTCLNSGEWEGGLSILNRIRNALGKSDPELIQRITQVYYSRCIREGDPYLLQSLIRVTDPLPLDPRWSRGLALATEHDEDYDVERVHIFWARYLTDLEGLTSLTPLERKTAQGLVAGRLGRILTREEDESLFLDDPENDDEGISGEGNFYRLGLGYFEKSLQLLPDQVATYVDYAGALEDEELFKEAVAVFQRLLQHSPDNEVALQYLISHFIKADDFLQARNYADRAHALKPLDQNMTALARTVHLGCARQYARKKKWEAGRAEFVIAEQLQAKGLPSMLARYAPLLLLARKAVFEFAAGETERAEQLLAEVDGLGHEAAATRLLLIAEGTRYLVSKPLIARFKKEWKGALKLPRSGAAAAQMAWILKSYLAEQVEFVGRAEILKEFLAYVGKSSRVKFQPEELRDICDCLAVIEGQAKLYEKLINKGWKEFPIRAYFYLKKARIELEKGPFNSKYKLGKDCLRRALELAEKSNDPEDVAIAAEAREGVGILDSMEERFRDSPFGGKGPHFSDMGFPNIGGMNIQDAVEAMMESLGIDPNMFMNEDESDLPSRPAPSRRRK